MQKKTKITNRKSTKPNRKKSKKQTFKKNVVIKEKEQKKTIKKGGFWLTQPRDSDSLSKRVERAGSSENNLIKSYEKMTGCVENYYQKYNSHLKNLISVDDMINVKSMETLFKKEIIKKHFKSDIVDKSNPLLLRNYYASSINSPSAFIKEHLIKQIRYKLYFSFSEKDRSLITDIQVKLVDKKSIAMIVRTIENKVHNKSIKHNNYYLNMTQILRELKRILDETRESLGYHDELKLLNGAINTNDISENDSLEINDNDNNNNTGSWDIVNSNDVGSKRKGKNNSNNSNNSGSMMLLIDEGEKSNITEPSGKPIRIFDELGDNSFNKIQKAKEKQQKIKDKPLFNNIPLDAQENAKVNLREKLIIGGPQQGQPGMGMGMGMGQQDMGMGMGMGQQDMGQQAFRMANQPQDDPVEQKCRIISDQQQCEADPDCWYNRGSRVCHKDMKR